MSELGEGGLHHKFKRVIKRFIPRRNTGSMPPDTANIPAEVTPPLIAQLTPSIEQTHQPLTEITPSEAVDKLVSKESESLLGRMRDTEHDSPGATISLMLGGTDFFLPRVSYGSGNSPNFITWDGFFGAVAGNFILREGEVLSNTQSVSSEEYKKVDYKFGRDGLTPLESIQLYGDSFTRDAQVAIASGKKNILNTTSIAKEIRPGVTLHIDLAEPTHWAHGVPVYEAMKKGQEAYPIKAIGSYATVPVLGEAPLTARGIVENARDTYLQDFRRRYAPIAAGASPKDLGIYFRQETPIDIERTLSWYVNLNQELGNPLPQHTRVEDMLADPSFFPDDIKLFMFANIKYMLESHGKKLPAETNSTLDEQMAASIPVYTELKEDLAAKQRQAERERLKLFMTAQAQDTLPTMPEQERQAIITRNVELLDKELIARTSPAEEDDQTQEDRLSIVQGERHMDTSTESVFARLTIIYDTATGRIGGRRRVRQKGVLPGAISSFSSELETRGREIELQNGMWVTTNAGSNEIILTVPEDEITRSELDRAIMGDQSNAPDDSDRRIIPSRFVPDGQGGGVWERERIGESAYTPNVAGDEILIASLEAFNQRFKLD